MMTVDFQPLQAALQRRLDIVADRDFYARDAGAHLAELIAASAEVDRHAAEIAPAADPTLRHYLERQSYVKALDWLRAHAPRG